MKKKTLSVFLVLFGILLVIVSMGLYLIPTVNINTVKGTVEIEYPRCYIKDGIFAPKRYVQYELIPSHVTKADVTYRVIVDNGLVRQEDKVSWTSLELGILKSKVITHSLSVDEYVAISMQPKYETMVYEVKAERDFSLLMIPVVYAGILVLAVMSGVGRRQEKPVERHRVVHRHAVAEKPKALMDEEQARLCMQCNSFKMVAGVLRCTRDICPYQK